MCSRKLVKHTEYRADEIYHHLILSAQDLDRTDRAQRGKYKKRPRADGKQDKASELDMITLRNHAPRSHMT